MSRATVPISEDTPEVVRVPVVLHLPVLPYYAANQRYEFHADECDRCAGDSCFPCPDGGALGDAAWTALDRQRSLAQQN